MAEEEVKNNQQPEPSVDLLSSLQGFGDINVNLKVLLGKIKMPIGQYLKISRGSIVELGKPRTETMDILANGHKFAECEISLTDLSEKVAVEIIKTFKIKKF